MANGKDVIKYQNSNGQSRLSEMRAGFKERVARENLQRDEENRKLNPGISRLQQMQVDFQAKLQKEKEEKISRMYEDRTHRAIDRVNSNSGGTQRKGMLRDFFNERRELENGTNAATIPPRDLHYKQKKREMIRKPSIPLPLKNSAGRDRGNPLAPIDKRDSGSDSSNHGHFRIPRANVPRGRKPKKFQNVRNASGTDQSDYHSAEDSTAPPSRERRRQNVVPPSHRRLRHQTQEESSDDETIRKHAPKPPPSKAGSRSPIKPAAARAPAKQIVPTVNGGLTYKKTDFAAWQQEQDEKDRKRKETWTNREADRVEPSSEIEAEEEEADESDDPEDDDPLRSEIKRKEEQLLAQIKVKQIELEIMQRKREQEAEEDQKREDEERKREQAAQAKRRRAEERERSRLEREERAKSTENQSREEEHYTRDAPTSRQAPPKVARPQTRPQTKPSPATKSTPWKPPKSPTHQEDEPQIELSDASFYATRAAADPDAVEAPVDLSPCGVCGRNFATDRLARHEKACVAANKKRKVLDPVKMRTAGTEAAQFVNSKKPDPPKKKSNWRAKHEDFIQTLKHSKKVSAIESAGGSAADLPPPPRTIDPDLVSCPTCNRRFNSDAAQRHMPFCKEQAFKKQQRLGNATAAKRRR